VRRRREEDTTTSRGKERGRTQGKEQANGSGKDAPAWSLEGQDKKIAKKRDWVGGKDPEARTFQLTRGRRCNGEMEGKGALV